MLKVIYGKTGAAGEIEVFEEAGLFSGKIQKVFLQSRNMKLHDSRNSMYFLLS